MPSIVAYQRVSTDKQGKSGLGLDAQVAAIAAYAATAGLDIIASFTEIESGKVNARPELTKALHRAKVTGATLVIAKLDRLSRNASFLMALQDSAVRFTAADNPHANDMTIGFLAIIAQHERQAISARTKAALAIARARGTKLGNPNGASALHRAAKGNHASIATAKAKADSRATDMRPIIDALRLDGFVSLNAIAKELTARRILTARRKTAWTKSSVRDLLARLAIG